MKRRLLDWLACPACHGALALTRALPEAGDIVEGELACSRCAARYPITRGIPRLLPKTLAEGAVATARRFGYEWTRFPEIRPEYEEQMLGWIAPVGRDEFVGRRVLDAGCGKGRHLRLASAFGAKDAIGIDLGPAVDAAVENTADLDNVHVVQGDLTRPPFRPASMDLIYSIGVLHHLPEPEAGFRALAPLLAPSGRFVAWLYAREGNGWVLALVDPARRLTSRLPLPLVSAFAWILTVPLWIALRLLYAPARGRSWLRRLLPYESYLSDLVPFPFREVHSIAFDQLLAPVAHYMPREHVERCFAKGGLTLLSLRWHHANSWAASGTRSEAR
ncbi:MAG: methyltransferase domain-containing protein [Candidatus Rokuibacteriota bacterium]